MITVKFYRDNVIVRTELCSNVFEADTIAVREKHNYTRIVLEYEEKDGNVI